MMTREEAIEYLKRADVTVWREVKTTMAEALETAIKALEQDPSEDAVSRKAVFETFGELLGTWGRKALMEMPSVTLIQRWIPVSERLPEEHVCDDGYVEPSEYVLVLGDRGQYGVSRYWGNRKSKADGINLYKDWVDLNWVVEQPIAWMPLPQPYKAESEE